MADTRNRPKTYSLAQSVTDRGARCVCVCVCVWGGGAEGSVVWRVGEAGVGVTGGMLQLKSLLHCGSPSTTGRAGPGDSIPRLVHALSTR